VSQYHKGKTNLDFTEARDSEWKWYQLGHITTPAPHHSVFTGRVPFLPPNQQRQSTGEYMIINNSDDDDDDFCWMIGKVIGRDPICAS